MTAFRQGVSLLSFCLRPRVPLFVKTLIAVAAFNAVELAFPKLLQLFVDSVAGNPLKLWSFPLDAIGTARGRFVILPTLLLAAAAVRWVITYQRSVLQTRLGQGALFDLRGRIFNTTQNLSFAYHDASHTGTLISNVVEDVNYASRFFQVGFFPMVEALSYIAFVYVRMFVICPGAALVSLGLALLAVPGSVIFFRVGLGRFLRTREYYSDAVQHFTENMEGQLVVRAYGLRQQQIHGYEKRVQRLHGSMLREIGLELLLTQSLVWGMTFGLAGTVAAAIAAAQAGAWVLTVGVLFEIFYLQRSLIMRTRMLTRGMNLTLRFGVTARRLQELFDADDYLPDQGTRPLPRPGPGAIEARSVSFAYGGSDTSVSDISLKIRAGETIGLVGATGSGKSTLALLLCRFYDPKQGTILLDGTDIRDYTVRTVRDQFSLVFQDTFLFSASVRDNIAYGCPDAPFEQIVHAATLAQAHEFIMQLPDQYGTVVGERGMTLSGGQRQRISLARAILRRPRFLILDASTSAVDVLTEKAIQDGFAALRETSTVIVIAQRYSSVAAADRVYVLDRGRLVESGTPAELNVPGTYFSRILQTQPEENS